MKCEHVRQLIPEWLGGELDAAESEKIEKHMKACPACRKEKEFWEDVGTALQDDRAWMKAPEGFAAGITARLEEEAPAKPGGIFTGWKRTAATAAAFLILAAGSLGAYFNWDSIAGGQMAEKDDNNQQIVDQREPGREGELNVPEPSQQEPGSGEAPGDQQDSENEPDTPVNNGGSDNNAGSGQQNSNNQGSGSEPSSGNSEPSNNNNSGEVTSNNGENNSVEPVLLNTDQKRVIEETLLRVSVTDLEEAQSKALNYIRNSGASYEMVTSGTSSNQKAIKITTESDNLLSKLKTLGKVTDEVKQNDDITGQYNSQVEEYRTLEAQMGDSDNKQIKSKMDSIMAQLEKWNNQAKTKTIILWLQK